MNYEESLNYLYGLTDRGIKLGLERINFLLDKMGRPEKNYKCIHVTGTNGKGSVCAMVAEALQLAGFKTALFTSPHLVDIRERFQVNGEKISKEKFTKLAEEMRELEKTTDDKPTFFETIAAMGFKYFSDERVDYAVIEVAMGGRLDATNVMVPAVSAITNIDLEHVDHLGTTVEKIAGEKAGIIKEGVPVVTATTDSALEVISKTAAWRNAPLHRVSKYNGEIGLDGEFQKENAAVAAEILKVIGVSPKVAADGITHVKWPGRMERRGNILLDCAHNAHGFRALAVELKKMDYDKCIFVLGLSQGKNFGDIFSIVNPLADAEILTKARVFCAADPQDYISHAKNPFVTATVGEAIKKAQSIASPADLIVVTGAYTVGEAMKFFGIGVKQV